MAQDDSFSLNLPDNPLSAQAGALVRLADQNRNKIAPIALHIDCQALRQWSEQHKQERFRYQNLIKEIKLWNGHLARRPLTHLWLDEPFCLIDAPNLIDLVHATGHYLRTPSRGPVERAVTLSPRYVSKQSAVLLNALKFNHVRIRIAPGESLDYVSALASKLTEFKIAYTSVVIDNGNEAVDKMRLMEVLSSIKPETLGFTQLAPILPALQDRSITALLMQFGYYLHPTKVIMRFRSKLNNPPQDCLRLGPGAVSTFGGACFNNRAHPDEYFLSLNQGVLPLSP